MPSLRQLRAEKPDSYPDQAVYAEYAAKTFNLAFTELDRGSGLAFAIASKTRRVAFGGGRGSYFPQNTATAATLAADKYLSAIVLADNNIPNLGGEYFFLGRRHRARRPDGHERDDALVCFQALGGAAFVKPLTGSRGDFACIIDDDDALQHYLHDVARHYDSIIMQPIFASDEYRLFVLDDAVLFSVQKSRPVIVGDGVTCLRDLMAARDAALTAHGVSSGAVADDPDRVLGAGQLWTVPGRMNRSAAGGMAFAMPPPGAAAMAIDSVRALGLRVGGVDLFTQLDGQPAMRVIEVNANPSIRFLEDSDRTDLILAIWRHSLAAVGLLDV